MYIFSIWFVICSDFGIGMLCYFYLLFVCFYFILFFFFKQKTAYEMRISDWSSDVCSSDLRVVVDPALTPSDFFQTGNLCTLTMLNGADELARFEQAVMCASIEPSITAAHALNVQRDRKSTRLNSSH